MKKRKWMMFYLILVILFMVSTIVYMLQLSPNDTTLSAQNKTDVTTQSNTSLQEDIMDQIYNYLTQAQIDTSALAISIYDFETQTTYEHNSDINFISASLYKVPLAMLFYDFIEEGSMKISDTLPYCSSCYEEGGPIGYTYKIGDRITLEELLYDVIVYSDNTAGHILFEYLGGWDQFRSLMQKYSDIVLDEDALLYNMFTSSYANDVLCYVYQHEDTYTSLIEHMKLVYPNDYLNASTTTSIAQKYGSYETAENSMGIIYDTHPYAITIMTNLGSDGIQVIGDINGIVYALFHPNGS